MLQNISMLDLRKRVGQVIDETFYRKDSFLIKRKKKAVAILIPVEDYEFFMADDRDIELYSKKRTQEFDRQDRLTADEKKLARRLLKGR